MEETTNIQNSIEHRMMSAEIGEIAQALSEFQSELKQPPLKKTVKVETKAGRSYTFKYADLSACMAAAAPLLAQKGLSVTQLITDRKLITLLAHKSGQWFKSEIGIGNASDYQALGSAITYLKRYSYCAILGIVADDDDDANAACGNKAEFVESKPKQAARKPQQPQGQPATQPQQATIPENEDTDLQTAIYDAHMALNKEALAAVYDNWKCYHDNKQFMDALVLRKKELGL